MNLKKKLISRYENSFKLGIIQHRKHSIKRKHLFAELEGSKEGKALPKGSFVELIPLWNMDKEIIVQIQKYLDNIKNPSYIRRIKKILIN